MQITKLTGFMGADISGVDLRQGISADLGAALCDALRTHGVLVLRNQHLSRADQKRLTAVFGPAMKLPYVEPMKDDPEVIAVLKEASEVNVGVFGGDWHSDFSFLENPPAGSVLNAVEIPHVGGDTLWASQVKAYESLPADLRAHVEGRKAVHVGAPYGVKHAPPKDTQSGASIKMTRGDPAADTERLHPAVITDPVSGAKALYLNPIYVTRLDGMSKQASAPVLAALYKHATKPDFCCRHTWQRGDVAIWDNRMTMHYATNDYDGQRRLLYRTTWSGERPA
ncbi:TauD/TfdA dioxygenase family protein [Sulfitobacter aestuariivivens]|uniref:TauD/TfdA family dioxygenase n=1 Tax=Sulfitobacter aestuariivivens TaxID=2766981 RepID=A0A927D463_9RHOB|nr:TauD/TfdA family dioxygenase [Sulfitobacter aestuariivivens]MBD3664041.1 TauD/TfdA family dioxygenase [Sulfitobacter aestuariivivens]